jgi:glutamate/tyrosine decarboxylase-like PLP-dependent enzyme
VDEGPSEQRRILRRTAELAADFLDTLGERPVFPEASAAELRSALDRPLPDEPTDPEQVVAELVQAAEPGVVAIPGGRYFGFVIGGALPATLAADWLAATWDQDAGLYAAGPSAAIVEEVAGRWVAELLCLPAGVSFGFVTGGQMANFTGLAAGRTHVLARAGWDFGADGLAGAPPIRVLVGAKRHVTIDRALRYLGIGRSSIVEVPADAQGRMLPDALRTALAAATGPTIVCAQAGEVNTGSFDPFPAIADLAEEAGAWLHVDGAFGLWAAASPRLRHLVEGVERADSWATDAHKWLNVPYDSGLAFCRHPDSHLAATVMSAAYLVRAGGESGRDPAAWTPESSRRARGFAVYAAVRSLGRNGVAGLVERCCAHASRLAAELAELDGAELVNEVVLNQVLLRFESDERTSAILRHVQASGEAWMGGTTWDERAAIRISVSNWQTSDADVDRTVAAFAAAASSIGAFG